MRANSKRTRRLAYSKQTISIRPKAFIQQNIFLKWYRSIIPFFFFAFLLKILSNFTYQCFHFATRMKNVELNDTSPSCFGRASKSCYSVAARYTKLREKRVDANRISQRLLFCPTAKTFIPRLILNWLYCHNEIRYFEYIGVSVFHADHSR